MLFITINFSKKWEKNFGLFIFAHFNICIRLGSADYIQTFLHFNSSKNT